MLPPLGAGGGALCTYHVSLADTGRDGNPDASPCGLEISRTSEPPGEHCPMKHPVLNLASRCVCKASCAGTFFERMRRITHPHMTIPREGMKKEWLGFACGQPGYPGDRLLFLDQGQWAARTATNMSCASATINGTGPWRTFSSLTFLHFLHFSLSNATSNKDDKRSETTMSGICRSRLAEERKQWRKDHPYVCSSSAEPAPPSVLVDEPRTQREGGGSWTRGTVTNYVPLSTVTNHVPLSTVTSHVPTLFTVTHPLAGTTFYLVGN